MRVIQREREREYILLHFSEQFPRVNVISLIFVRTGWEDLWDGFYQYLQ